ncbi:hypothetical protein I3F58_14850 [Streptomyces sp. MUM 203J]|uniref:Rv1733c family protein n=1 Tax=Streptomyces sp. MUM 203J TaxID=2791990 RepID=UPI001F0413CA|nr:hypothetical protein [Streptomyces sp. MUM 203J]MCH0540825.1 hypothetical protein [Streptomyces sp. MUM 203J]
MNIRFPHRRPGTGTGTGADSGAARPAHPLERPVDRLQRRVDRALLALLLLGLPLAAWLAGAVTHAHYQDAREYQEATRQPVAARLVEDASPSGPGGRAGKALADVRWQDDGRTGTGTAAVEPGARAGDRTTVWVDRDSGRVVAAPLSPTSVTATTAAVALTAAGGTVLLVGGARTGLRRFLDARRYAGWEAEWALTEPHWSGRDRNEP